MNDCLGKGEIPFISPISLIDSKKDTEYLIRLEWVGMWVGIKNITHWWGLQVGISLAAAWLLSDINRLDDGTEKVENESWCCFPLWQFLYPAYLTWHKKVTRGLSLWRHNSGKRKRILPDRLLFWSLLGILIDFNFILAMNTETNLENSLSSEYAKEQRFCLLVYFHAFIWNSDKSNLQNKWT